MLYGLPQDEVKMMVSYGRGKLEFNIPSEIVTLNILLECDILLVITFSWILYSLLVITCGKISGQVLLLAENS